MNIAAPQLEDPALIETVESALAEAGLPPAALCLEITEDSAMKDIEQAIRTLQGLKKVGVEIALDDFGIGHSSLGYLQRFPLDLVKIDRSFVADMVESEESFAIVRALVALTHSLGARCVAEGIEYWEQSESLHQLGCDLAQGYLFSPPLPAADAGLMIAAGDALSPASAAAADPSPA